MAKSVHRLLLCVAACCILACSAVRVHEPINGFNCSVVIRGSSSLHGTYADQGQAVVNAINVWADWVNSTHGGITLNVNGVVQKCGLDLLLEDDWSQEERAVNISRTYAEEADLLICPYSSSLVEAVGPVSEEFSKVMLSAAAATWAFEGKRFLFGLFTPGEKLLDLVIRSLALRGAKRIANFREDVAYTNSVCSGIDLSIARLGGDVEHVADIPVPKDANNSIIIETIEQLKAANADVIIGCTYYDVCSRMLPLANEMNLEPLAYAFTACVSEPGFIQDMGYIGNYILGSVQWDTLMDYKCEMTGWTPADYGDIYRERYGLEPTYQSTAYVGGLLAWLYVVEKLQSTDSYDVALMMGKIDLQTVYGNMGFDENSMYNGQPAYLQFQDLDKKIVLPELIANAPMVYPMPAWTQQECEMQYGASDCRCSPDGCPPCTRDDYTYTVGSCNENAMQEVVFHLEPFICDRKRGVNLPNSFKVPCTYLPADSAQAYVLIMLTTVGITVALACAIAVLIHRKNKYVLAAQPLFLILFLVGAIIVFAGNIMPLGEQDEAQCLSLAWILLLGSDIMLGAINVKLYRIWRIFGNRRLVRVKVTHWDMLKVIGGIMLFDVLMLTLWSALYEPITTRTWEEEYDVVIKANVCNVSGISILWASLAIKAFMILTASVFSHQTRNVDRKFLQSNLIMYAMYQIAVMIVIGVAVVAIVEGEANTLFVRMFVVALSTLGAIAFIVVFRLFAVYRQTAEEHTQDKHTGNSGVQMSHTDKHGNKRSVDSVDSNLSPEQFAELLFSPAALMDMTDRLNVAEDENRHLKEQVREMAKTIDDLKQELAEFKDYVREGTITPAVQAVMPRTRASLDETFTRKLSRP